MKYVKVEAPAHLHAGNMDLNGELGRLYGTVGFTIDSPSVVVRVEKWHDIEANDPYAKRFAESLVRTFKVEGVRVFIEKRFYAYSGLGYVTALCFAVGKGLSELYNLDLPLERIAMAVRRGLLTALGLYSCKHGGFIVEGGFKNGLRELSIPPLVYRGEIPGDWLFVVAIPKSLVEKSIRFREASEDKALNEVHMDSSTASYLSRLALMKIIPSFIEKDVQEFGEALTEFNKRLGFVWLKYQGGVYCSPIVEKGIEIMLRYAYGACQSSWGPTFYGITDSEDRAKKLVDELNSFLKEHGGGETFIARGRNKGLEVVEHG